MAFLLESSWLPAKQQLKIKITQHRSKKAKILKKKRKIMLFLFFFKKKGNPWLSERNSERGRNRRIPLPAAFCFSRFFSRAILAFWPLPPPMADLNGRENSKRTLLYVWGFWSIFLRVNYREEEPKASKKVNNKYG